LEETLRLGQPPRVVQVELTAAEDGPQLALRVGRRATSDTLPVRAITDATLERVEVADGHHVAILRGTGPDETAVAAVIGVSGGRPTLLWSGRTDFHGDPGERSGAVLTLEDRTGDGRPDVVVGVRREGATLCGERDTLLLPRAYDPSRGTMRPVTLSRLDADAPTEAVTATRDSPGPEGAPLLPSLQARGSSSRAGYGESIDALGPPRALTDGRTETYWAEGRGGPGTGEFAALRWTARFFIRALALRPATGEGAERLGRPRELWVVGDEGPRLRVTIPEDPARHPGERWWIVPDEPLSWDCLAVVLDSAYAPDGVEDAAVHTAIGEIEVYTELDFGDGVRDLVGILVEGGSGGDEATRLLSGLGGPAVEALSASWERLDEQGRRRGVRVLVANARRGVEPAVDGLARAAMDDAETVRTSALEALGTLGPRAGELLAQLVLQPAPVGDAAVRPLLRHEPAVATAALLTALEGEGGSERPTAREGLARALGRGDGEAQQRFSAWVAEEPSIAALASALLGLSDFGATRALARPLLTGAVLERASRFEDRWRLVRAARELPSDDDEVDAWLGAVAREAEEWMLRAAAVEALGRRDAPDRGDVARAALDDDYPRVRVQAIGVLDALDRGDEQLARLLRQDSWPMVREAAVEALWNRPGALAAIRRASRDRSGRVRRAAVRALTRAGDREAWPLVRARLADEDEEPQVTVAALRYVRRLCVREAGPRLLELLERGIRPDAFAPHVDVAAVAADLALILGGETAERAGRIATGPHVPASIRRAIARRRRSPAQCEAR
ncbi:MAG TPA: HEAT repeat domain-containing protein, partial [Sandaracinaceae bacterium LLY-WYZ-13_1]|nr:HEAT repeat domain-containing protein [Sandaracinaceae bacterium LLY-WYZ-13_1]